MNYKKSYCMRVTGIWSGVVMIFIGGCLEIRCGVAMIGNAIAVIGLMLMTGGIVQALREKIQYPWTTAEILSGMWMRTGVAAYRYFSLSLLSSCASLYNLHISFK